MKLVTWNVNGLRACVNKGFMDFFNEVDSDIFSVQETKLQKGQIEMDIPGYEEYWDYAEKKGYSGTATFSKIKPISVKTGLEEEKFSKEGR
ncbi:endonuclease/exonuclease/phosphatase family protein, partial [Anaerofustis stercorihominis]